jgi:hypothetical protein
MTSLTDIVNEAVRQAFNEIVQKEITELEAMIQKRMDAIFEEQRRKAKDMANKMTLELMQKANVDGLSVEFKL